MHQQKFYALANPPNLTNEKLECFKCKREVITCQYAYHLAECMGNEMDRVSRLLFIMHFCNIFLNFLIKPQTFLFKSFFFFYFMVKFMGEADFMKIFAFFLSKTFSCS